MPGNIDIYAAGRDEGKQAGSPQPEGNARAGYLAFAAHEVRNPLSTALWSAELLSRMTAADRGGARGEKLSRMCLRALARLRQLIEDHFLIERLEAGGLPMRVEPLDVKEVLAAIVGRRPSESSPCEMVSVPSATVSADRILLERSLDALLGVAGQGGASIRVSGELADGRISLSVQGAPPPEGGLADPGRNSTAEGKAQVLALPVARRAARVMGGELRIEGGAYRLALPAQQAAQTTFSE